VIGGKTAENWMQAFEERDVCCSIVATLEEAVRHPQFQARQTFQRTVAVGDATMPALPLPIVDALSSKVLTSPPDLGGGLRDGERGPSHG